MDRETATDALPTQLTLFDEPTGAHFGPASPPRLAQLAGRIVEYRFVRSRRRTIGISVDARGLEVAAPRTAPWRDIEAFLHDKARWIVARLDEWAGAPPPRAIHGVSGEIIPLSGEPTTLEVYSGREGVGRDGMRVLVTLPEPQRRAQVLALLVDWLKTQALGSLAPRAAHYAKLLGCAAPRVKLSRARSEWGVCTESGLIRLNWRLVHLEPALTDYVVAHEVAHLVELNHSKRFWNLVATLYPRWQDARARLELAGASLPLIRGVI
jgi:predicted metal-dependent hydrolase